MVYARNKINIRTILWHELQQTGTGGQDLWMLSGDFNKVLNTKDRVGQPITDLEVQGFKDMIENLYLTSLYQKVIFTLSATNNWGKQGVQQVRLGTWEL